MTVPVTVVIPCYNAARFVPEAVESVLTQSTPPREVIVVDDGSTDETSSRLAPYVGRIRCVHQTNQGVSAARNRGLELATQEFVAFLDADDFWHPRKLEVQLREFERDPRLGLLGTKTFPWPGAVPSHDERSVAIRSVPWSALVVRNHIATSSILMRQSLAERVGPFDRSLQGPEDRDFLVRVAEHAPLAKLESPLTGYRDVEGSVSKQAARCEQGMRRLLEKLDERGAWGRRWLLRRKAYSYFCHSCANLHSESGRGRSAFGYSVRSLMWYPLPFGEVEVEKRCERLRRTAVNALRWLRVRS